MRLVNHNTISEEEIIMEQQNGSMLLKVMSIIMMIGGIVGAVASFIYAIVVGVFQTAVIAVAADGKPVNGAAVPIIGLLWVGVIILVAGAVVEIIAGVKGKNNWNNPAQAQSLMILGIVAAVLSLIGNILFATGSHSVQFFTIISGLVVPVLYIIGTIQLKNQQQ